MVWNGSLVSLNIDYVDTLGIKSLPTATKLITYAPCPSSF